MNKRLAFYQYFIDSLAKLKEGIMGTWVKEKGFPNSPENKEINDFLSKLSPKEKEIIAQITQKSRLSGMHAVLVFLQDEINLRNLKISKNEIEMANEPYSVPMYYDWLCRCEGDPWPSDKNLDKAYQQNESL